MLRQRAYAAASAIRALFAADYSFVDTTLFSVVHAA
jgi:hypothetical protein